MTNPDRSRRTPAGRPSRTSRTARQIPARPRRAAPVEPLENRLLFATFDVTSNADLVVPLPGTLRYAITMADAMPGADTITFHIAGGDTTIRPLTDLPAVTGPTTLDATTQPGYSGSPIVFLDGSTTLQLTGVGLDFTGGSSTLRGLAVSGFNTAGVHLAGAGGHTVQASYIGPDPSGEPSANELPPQNTDGIVVDSPNDTITTSLISGNFRAGIRVNPGGTDTLITANFIGTDAAGTTAFGNFGTGITVTGAGGVVIGGDTAATRNLISGNNGDGVLIDSAAAGNVVSGNYVGTDVTGAAPLGNGGDGVRVTSTAAPGAATDVLIGGTAADARNVISANFGDGVGVIDAAGVRVFNNYIGTDVTGTFTDTDQLGNFGNGVSLAGAAADTAVGGPSAAQRNVIADNSGDGVRSTATGTGNVISGNFIGTDATGSAAIGNFGNGVSVYGAGLLVGGSTPAAANVISANFGFGVGLFSDGSSVQSNLIGTAADGTTALGNHDDDVNINGSDNVIGSPTTGNTIAFSGHNGVTVSLSPTYLRNAIRGNDIFSNVALGIDLGNDGVTLNDPEDPDVGPNNFQNFPDLSSVTLSGGTATLHGNLNSTPLSTFTLDFFASPIWDDTHYGEGQRYLGSITVTTDATGNAPFTATLPGVPAGYTYFAATATDATGNTSEFDYDPPATAPAAAKPSTKPPVPLAAAAPASTAMPDSPAQPTTNDDLLGVTPSKIV